LFQKQERKSHWTVAQRRCVSSRGLMGRVLTVDTLKWSTGARWRKLTSDYWAIPPERQGGGLGGTGISGAAGGRARRPAARPPE